MKYYIIAGEASGDLHGSNLIAALKTQDKEAEFCFWGGDLMQKQTKIAPIKHYKEMAFMGFIRVILNLRKIKANMTYCKQDIKKYNPDVVILIDYAGFNLRIAEFSKSINIPVHFYISPKIWAWKTNRVHKIKKYVDKMLTILPFETEFYRRYNFNVDYVGNPILDAINNRPNKEQTFESFSNENNLDNKPIIGLLAGSRKQEIKLMLPVMIEASKFFPNYQFVIAGAPGIDNELYQSIIGNHKIQIIYNKTYPLLQQCTAALVTSGTATLETALFNVPQIVCYKTNMGNLLYKIGRHLLKVKWISLVNLILNKEAVLELTQNTFKPRFIIKELTKILNDIDYKNQIMNSYKELHERIGKPGASERAGKLIYQTIKD